MSLKIGVINGPNLNLLGTREPTVYGTSNLQDLESQLQESFPDISFAFYQSNVEGEIINALHEMSHSCGAIIINPAGYSHTSVAIADAIAALPCDVVEVHISNIHSREDYRHQSLTGAKSVGVISGFGLEGYRLAVDFLRRR
jgi:3-dehydroquinate dehydratase II